MHKQQKIKATRIIQAIAVGLDIFFNLIGENALMHWKDVINYSGSNIIIIFTQSSPIY